MVGLWKHKQAFVAMAGLCLKRFAVIDRPSIKACDNKGRKLDFSKDKIVYSSNLTNVKLLDNLFLLNFGHESRRPNLLG